jgi:hypothetical protein
MPERHHAISVNRRLVNRGKWRSFVKFGKNRRSRLDIAYETFDDFTLCYAFRLRASDAQHNGYGDK